MNQHLQKNLNTIFCITIFCLIFTNNIFGQTGILTTGGNATGSTGTVSYSVGQVFYLNHESTTGTIHEGLQQAYEIFSVDIPGIESGIEITMFPNPANNYFVIKANETEGKNLRYQIFNSTGQLVETNPMSGVETIVPVEMLLPSSYFIHIQLDNVTIKTFKLIKHSR